jgi:hypothetical protein
MRSKARSGATALLDAINTLVGVQKPTGGSSVEVWWKTRNPIHLTFYKRKSHVLKT